MLEWVPAGLNTGALSGAKASSSRTRDNPAKRTSIRKHVMLKAKGLSQVPVSRF
jgi:hypothetical protein